MKKYTLSALLAFTGAFITDTSHGAAFQNGSFEINGGEGTQVATGWVFTPNGGSLQVGAGQGHTDGAFGMGFNTAGSNGGAVLSQTFTTLTGQTYIVSFDWGEFGNGVNQPQALQVTVQDGSSNNLIVSGSGSILNGSGGNNSNVSITQNTNILKFTDGTSSSTLIGAAPNAEFSTASFNFIASSTSTTITFTDISTNGTVGNSDGMLDNVKVTAVPEPSTWLSMMGGLGMLLGFRRRRAV